MELRPYQKNDVKTLRSTVLGGARRVLFEASVGYGKSVVIEHLAHAYAAAGRPVFVLSNRKAVVDQLRKRARGHDLIQVMTVQAADARRDRLPKFCLVLIDEAHMGGAATQYARVVGAAAHPGTLVVDFTGTPTPGLFKLADAHVAGRDAAWLTAHGFLSPLEYWTPYTPDLSGVALSKGDYQTAGLLEVAEREKAQRLGSVLESYTTRCAGEPTLGFCIDIADAEAVAARFHAEGIAAEVLTGRDGEDETARKIRALQDGGLVLSVSKVSAGFDLPDLRHILALRPTKSPHLWVQMLGRAARAAEGKPCGVVHDHSGNADRLGTLTLKSDWRAGGQPGPDERTEDGRALGVRTCEQCMRIWESAGGSVCPACGHDNRQDRRISEREAVEMRKREAAEIDARHEAEKAIRDRAGRPVKQHMGFLFNAKGWRWPDARAEAARVAKRRLDQAERAGDVEVAALIRSDLEAVGIRP
ncbi:hypothetical protein DLJ49_20135 [Rhodovulum sp. 12E13]|uniref:DEAD/DEAH box helicase n=1 Tax=Rhodovulum sp. 12E13 TaxID=2203891 RepID=UPI000E16826F|nr:DEAD/DEAH box helicase family protein [Rhodovulum sp. 12E13]RDC68083.1 hypothetical protein DLJ49_20135 [Rhodovulum sp. 12E13]